MKKLPVRLGLCLALSAAACSTAPRSEKPTGAAPTPTPSVLSRINPNIVEETATYIVERFPKKNYIRVDDRHIRSPIIGPPVEFFKEDADYYYVQTPKPPSPEELALRREAERKAAAAEGRTSLEAPKGPVISPSEFTDIVPPRVGGRIRLEEVKASGLPSGGMWRSSFEVADLNGDGIPDIVAPPARLGGQSTLHVWIGDGKGKFSRWPITFTEGGKPKEAFSLAYGGVAVGDLDGDGKPDVVAASHMAGLVALYGDGRGSFEVVRTGLPGRAFSSQAVALADADGDGKLDIVASTDGFGTGNETNLTVDKQQVRVYLNRGAKGWEFKQDGIVGGFYSNSVEPWDYDGDGAKDILTGSHYVGALALLWKNDRNGTFSPISFPEIEMYSYHFATSSGTFGPGRAPAFAETISMHAVEPEPLRASGITIYSYSKGEWTRHRLWKKKGGNMLLYALAMGDLDGDGLDDVVFPDSEDRRLRVFFQEPDGSFREMAQKEEPPLDSPGQCVRLADLDGDKRLDVVLSKTISSTKPDDRGGWTVWLNRSSAASSSRPKSAALPPQARPQG